MVGTLSDETIEQTVDNEIRAQYAGMEEEAAKNSLLPAILWRNSVDTAKIFCGFYGAVATPLFTAKIK